jgi:hypothetical protein
MKKLLLLLPFIFFTPFSVEAQNIGPSAIFEETTEIEDETTEGVEEEETTVDEETEEVAPAPEPEPTEEEEEEEEEQTVRAIRDFFTADNIILIINATVVGIFTVASVYLRVQVIAQKLFGKKTEEELAEAKARLAETEGQFAMIMGSVTALGDNLTSVVEASKMSPEDKLRVAEHWAESKVRIQDFLKSQKERLERYKEAISDAGTSLWEIVGETKDVLEKYLPNDDATE